MHRLGMQGRKWEIFLSAVNLFSEYGYNSISMRDVAAANGLRVSSLYNHFPSKEAILDQIYQFYYENIKDVAPDLASILSVIPEKKTRRSVAYGHGLLQRRSSNDNG